MPYPYTYFNPGNKEKIALGAGSVIAALLGAATGDNAGDAAVRGVASGLSGFGQGYNTYQNYMNDAWQRNMADQKYGQQIREYEEVDKPYKQAQINNISKYGTMGEPPRSVQEYEYGKNLPESDRAKFDEYATGITSTILAARAAAGDKNAQLALEKLPQSNVIYNTDTGVKRISKVGGGIEDTGLTQKPEISNEAVKEIGTTKTILDIGSDLNNLANRVAMGPISGKLETLKGNWFNGLSSEEQLEFNAGNQQLFNILGELRSGKVITENEYNRLLGELPHVNLPFNTYKNRLSRFNRIMNKSLSNRLSTYNEANYNVSGFGNKQPESAPSPLEQPIKQSASRTITKEGIEQSTGKKVIQYSDGSIEYAQ